MLRASPSSAGSASERPVSTLSSAPWLLYLLSSTCEAAFEGCGGSRRRVGVLKRVRLCKLTLGTTRARNGLKAGMQLHMTPMFISITLRQCVSVAVME